MAQITLNGGEQKTRIIISPLQPPKLVMGYRALERIHTELSHFQMRFATTQDTKDGMFQRLGETNELSTKYVEALQSCAAALRTEIGEMPEEKRAYYLPVLIFLSRAANAHSIIPWNKYLVGYAGDIFLSEGGQSPRTIPVTVRGFIEQRIAESIKTCEAYLALLSNSLDSHMRFVSLNEILSSIITTVREISMFRFWDGWEETKKMKSARQLHDKGVQMSLGPTGEIITLSPLAYFLLHQIISNAFKASFAVYAEQQKNPSFRLSGGYDCMPLLNEPVVAISTERADATTVKVVISDNGIGIPAGMIERVFADSRQDRLGVFVNFIASNGSSVALFPFLADLLSVKMVLSSDGAGRGFRAELLFPVDIHFAYQQF